MSLDPFANVLRPVLENRPPHWEVGRFGVEFRESEERNGSEPIGPMLSVSSYRGVEVQASDAAQRPSADVAHYRVVRPGQLAANMMWLNFGGLGVSSMAGYISPAYKAFWISDRMDARFVHHLLRSRLYVDTFASLGQGVRPNSQMVASALLSMLPVLVPPRQEQARLAEFLDRETAEIDAMDAELNHLIQTLEERRTATIDAAFDGVRAKAPLWSLVHEVIDCPHTTPELATEGPAEAVRTSSVRRGAFIPGSGIPVSQKTADARNGMTAPVPGDVFFTREAPAGEACVVPKGNFCLGQRMVLIRTDGDRLDPQFLVYSLYSSETQEAFKHSAGGSTVVNLKLATIRNTRIPSIPRDQQRQVVANLDSQMSDVDEMIADANRLKSLLAERRSTLITEVVTGRKKVPA